MVGQTCEVCSRSIPARSQGGGRPRITCSTDCRNERRRRAYVAKGPKAPTPLAERLWSRTRTTETGCIEFTGCISTNGYGQIGRGARGDGLMPAHRAAWEVTHGPIPEGLVVMHRCDNRPCVNVEHLSLGTQAENMRDMAEKGRGWGARGTTNHNARLSREQVDEIISRYQPAVAWGSGSGRPSNARQLAEEFGITTQYVGQIVAGKWRRVA